MNLIDKDALVAEIEKIKCKVNDGSSYCNGWQHALRMLEIQLNTLEVKDEVKDMDIEKVYKEFVVEYPVYNKLINGIVCKAIAKHFFELGVKAQKGE